MINYYSSCFIIRNFYIAGVGYDTAVHLVPPEIDIACHNGPDSCTISGPADIVKTFVQSLKEKEIFAKEVKVSNIPYHSRYIAQAGPKLMEYMQKVHFFISF